MLAVKDCNYVTIQSLYSDCDIILDKVRTHPTQGDKEAEINAKRKEYLKIGFANLNWNHWEKSFYDQLELPYKYRFSQFHLPRNERKEEALFKQLNINSNYALCCNTSSKGTSDLQIETNFPKVFITPKTSNLLDWLLVIERASEIHTIDTSVFQLIKNMQLSQPKFFYVEPSRSHYQFDNQHWNVIN